MKDLVRIFQLEDEAKELHRKIEKWSKHNAERSPVGREGFHDQIEDSIRIWQNRREEILKELKELEEDGS